MTEAYRSFFDLLAAGVTAAVANARAYEDERQRAEARAELDRAKIAFFSNVSHEFRTPLTLILGPVEDMLARSHSELSPAARGQLEVVNRNGLRLLRLVNTLLDFSRIEAGRVRAVYQPTDLATFTADLASVFRSACERAGLRLAVDCPTLREPVFVDRDMWEKVVFNLLSNAFKFTFDGEIAVSLTQAGDNVELRVRDTGTGVPASEMPRLFERFHRVENAQGRTHEGSGIGLALVQELVRLHGGSIGAESEEGRGTIFTATLPLGTAHLPQDQIGEVRPAPKPGSGASPYVEEALRWLPDDVQSQCANRSELPTYHEPLPTPYIRLELKGGDDRPRVLVVDDNADMREYVARLLAEHYRIQVVPDGEAALATALERPPDLVLTDVMMPRLDGFGLLRGLRADARTRNVPVIMLSARAGEESRVEGMEAGADDYLIKPFGARELLARVGAHLQMARMRREASESIQASEERFRALMSATSDVVYRMSADWTELSNLRGREFIADTHEPSRSWLDKYIPPDDQPLIMEALQAAIRSKGVFELEHRVMRVDGTLGWTFSRAIPLLNDNGEIREWFGAASDVTAQKQAEESLRESEGKFRTLFESMDEAFCVIEMIFDADARPADYRFLEINPAFEKHTGLRDAEGKRMREIAPDHEAHWFEIYGRVAVTGEPIRFVNEAKALDGRWFDVYAFRLGDAPSRKVAVLFNNITDSKRAEGERRLLASIVENSSDFIGISDTQGNPVYVNRAAMELVGIEDIEQVRRSKIVDYFVPEQRQFVADVVLPAVIKDGRWGGELTFQHFVTGATIPVWYDLFRVDDPATGGPVNFATVTRDLTELKRIEAERESTQKTLAAIVERCPFGIYIVDDEFRMMKVNTTSENVAFVNVRPLIGRLFDEVVRIVWPEPVAADVIKIFRHTLDTGEPYSSRDFVSVRADIGQTEGYEWETHRIMLPNGRHGVVCYYFDATRLRQAERELNEADRHKDEFLATLAHELRNPLAPIRNGLQIMNLAQVDAGMVEKTRMMMERQVEQMTRLIDDLLDLSRINQGKIVLQKTRMPLADAVRNAVDTSHPLIDARRHELVVDMPPEPIYVEGDLTRLSQVFTNLLNNSAKYTDLGGRIRLVVEPLGNDAVVSVADNGVGIPADMLSHVFDMFAQINGSLEKSQGGLGIGLNIVKRLVEMHGGSIYAESGGPGMGSMFTVRLPAALSLKYEKSDNHIADEKALPAACRRILIVDDNQDGAFSLAMMLKLMGNDTQTAHDGLEAVAMSEAFKPNVILMDIGMPKLNGYDACRRIREQPWADGIVIIALTGWGQEEDRQKSKDAGFDGHVVKPVDHAALMKLLVNS